MTVKQFLSSYNIGRSAIEQATVIDTNVDAREPDSVYTYTKRELMQDAYGSRYGSLKVNTFTITTEKIVIYAK